MKYLKTYSERKFWLINCKNDAYFLASLRHIKCGKRQIDYFFSIYHRVNLVFPAEEYLYISEMGYMPYTDTGYNWYITNHEYMGEIIPTEEEIETAELEFNVSKYNL